MKEDNFLSSFIKGVIFSFILSIILFYILGIILTSSNIPEKIITPAILVITGISILISTSIVMIKNNEKGLIKRRISRNNIFYDIIFNFKHSDA